MSGPYTLTATPGLLAEGEHRGPLEYVTFTTFRSETGLDSSKWFVVNTGTLVQEFSRLVPRDIATDIVQRLREGEKVIVPGFYAMEEIRHNFHGRGLE